MQEVCCRKLSSALSPYGAERLIRGGIFHPATSPLCVAHTCLMLVHMDACNHYHADAHIPLPWMPAILPHADAHKLLSWMPAILPHADAHILLPRMFANIAHAEGGDFTNSVYRSFLASRYHFLLPHLDAMLGLLPSSYYFGDPRFTSLYPFTPNILGIAAHLAHLHIGRGPFGGSAQIHLTNANILSSNATE